MGTGGKLKLEEGTAGGTYVGFKASDTDIAAELIWTLPDADGAAGTMFATDGAKNLSFVDEAGARLAADSTLQANVNTEITARTDADNAEITSRANADVTLQANINSEATLRTNADNAEITARVNADSTLQANINASGTKVFEGTATYIDGLGTFSHGYSGFPLVMYLLVDAGGGYWEPHDAASFFKLSTTQVAPLGGTNLATAFVGSTNVKLFVTKTQVQ